MESQDTTLLNSLTDYILDAKPYHTKLKDLTTELFFKDSTDVIVLGESHDINVSLQNIWRKTDVGGWRLQDFSDGEKTKYQIPAVLVPRFSLNDSLQYGQEPASDPSTTLIDEDNSGFPDGLYPWARDSSQSHFVGSDTIPINIENFEIDYDFLTSVAVPSDPSNAYRSRLTYDVIIKYNAMAMYGCDLTDVSVILNDETKDYIVDSVIDEIITIRIQSVTQDITISPGDKEYQLLIDNIAFRDHRLSITKSVLQNRLMRSPLKIFLFAETDTGRYRLPFHNGSRVYVDGVLQQFGIDYTVEKSRSFIQFLVDHHPEPSARIDVNIFSVDKFFISVNDPFEYDTITGNGIDRFEITYDSSKINGYTVEFFNATPGSKKGKLEKISLYNPIGDRDGRKLILTAKSSHSFVLTLVSDTNTPIAFNGNGDGLSDLVQYGKSYSTSYGQISFLITNSWTDYYVDNDIESYKIYDLSTILNFSLPNIYEISPVDHLVNLNQNTARGSTIDSSSTSYDINPIGHIKRFKENEKDTFYFVFNTPAKIGSYIEFRIEQADQYNQTLNTNIVEKIRFYDLIKQADSLCTTSDEFHGYRKFLSTDKTQVDNGTILSGDILLSTDNYIKVIDLFEPTCLNPLDTRVGYDIPLWDDTEFDLWKKYPTITEELIFDVNVGSNVNNNGVPIATIPYSKKICFVKMYNTANVYEAPETIHELVLVKNHLNTLTAIPIVLVYDGVTLLTENVDYIITKKQITIQKLSSTYFGHEIKITLVSKADQIDKNLNAKQLKVVFNAPPPSILSISEATATEGSNLTHTVTLSSITVEDTTFPLTLVGNTATTSIDFSNSLSFNNGVTFSAGTITVPTGTLNFTVSYAAITDALTESPETTSLTIGLVTATGTIIDPIPMLTTIGGRSVTPLVLTSNSSLNNIVDMSAGAKWYGFSVTTPGTYSIETNAHLSGIDTELGVYDASGSLLANDDDSNGGGFSISTIILTTGIYYVVVGRYNMGFGSSFSVSGLTNTASTCYLDITKI